MRFLSKQKKLILSAAIITLSLNLTLTAESFRVGKVHTVKLDNDSENTAKLGIIEALAIQLPEDKTFIEGVEIKMDIPEEIASWMDCVACSVYDNVKPYPTSSQIDYNATRQYVSTLPGRLSWILQIPIKKNNSIKTNKYTTKIDTIPAFEQNIIFIRLQPVMKGVPEETLRAVVPMTIKPLLIDKGKLVLNLKDSEDADFDSTVYVDEKLINYSKQNNSILLDTGVHTISVVSDSYRNEVRTVRIDQAKVTNLEISLKSTEPTLTINAPESAEVILDGNKCTDFGTEFQISAGEHKVKFSIGDYEIIRTIQAVQGKSYTANFYVDLEIQEE